MIWISIKDMSDKSQFNNNSHQITGSRLSGRNNRPLGWIDGEAPYQLFSILDFHILKSKTPHKFEQLWGVRVR